ncbi:MAG TPA: AIR synthase-related protein, partial [Beijerinckiaceae bacterium]|nr:AIR synthase-related protein [Beijerinckiaceae bacterium]
ELPEPARAAADIAYLVPDPANELACVLLDHASAAMDISDGLVGDAGKLAAASGCGLIIDTRLVPFPAGIAAVGDCHPALVELCITGGDDYQVLAAIPPHRSASFEQAARKAGRPVTRIGALTAAGTRIIGRDGRDLTLTRGSFSHF